jgi:hypothetical protein
MAEGRDSLVQQAAQKILVAVAARQRARDTARKTTWNIVFDYKGRMRGNARALADAGCLRLRAERILDFHLAKK